MRRKAESLQELVVKARNGLVHGRSADGVPAFTGVGGMKYIPLSLPN
jgi:hypothetical protein